MNLLLLSFALISQETDEPPCAHSSLLGKWVGPESEMVMNDECKAEMGEIKFDYDDSDHFKRGDDKCKVFQKANEIVVDCGKDEVERYHRFNSVVHK